MKRDGRILIHQTIDAIRLMAIGQVTGRENTQENRGAVRVTSETRRA